MGIRELGEFGLIGKIAAEFEGMNPAGVKGIGDDCAVVPYSDSESFVVTTDALVENIHFLKDRITPFELGYKSLAVNLSDIAAMGAEPYLTFLSIALPEDVSPKWCEEFIEGYKSHNIALVGGDTTGSKSDIFINITVIGRVKTECIKLRSAALPGDRIYVTGYLGDSAGGLHCILNNIDNKYLIKSHNMPRPHLAEGLWLGNQPEVHAMMDISDGLASDLVHILKASGVGAEVDLEKIPVSKPLSTLFDNPIQAALGGGEDYVILFTATPEWNPTNSPFASTITEIGHITDTDTAIKWMDKGVVQNLNFKGFRHF